MSTGSSLCSWQHILDTTPLMHRPYIIPKASGSQLLAVSRHTIILAGLLSAALTVALHQVRLLVMQTADTASAQAAPPPFPWRPWNC